MTFHFPGQKDTEQVIWVFKKHWISDLKVAAVFFIFGVIPIFSYLFLAIKYFPGAIENSHLIILFIFSFYLLCVSLVTFIFWLNHELDILIVTNERVINHDQVGFLNRQVAEANLDQIQDVRGTEKGLIQTIFHFGRIELRTAGDRITLSLHDAENSFANARKIIDVRDTYLKELEK